MTAVLGLDIGGSTTRAVRAEDGRCVAEARAGSANIRSVGAAEAGRQLDAVLAGLRTDDVAAVCAGAAGADSAPARAALGELLAQAAPGGRGRGRARRPADPGRRRPRRGHRGDRGHRIRGLGPSRPDGREARAGGFGYLLGDEGSGYWTAREAVRHVLHRADTGAAPDALGAALLAACGVATPRRPVRPVLRPARARVLGRARRGGRAAGRERPRRRRDPRPRRRRPRRASRRRSARGSAAPGPWCSAAGSPCTSPRCAPPSPPARRRGPRRRARHPPRPGGRCRPAAPDDSWRPHDHDTHAGRPDGRRDRRAARAVAHAAGRRGPGARRRGRRPSARYDPHTVLLVARGTSDHAALYAKYLVEIRLGKAAGLVSPSTMTAYGARPDFRGVLMIAVSQSGGSPDLVRSLEVARDCGALTVAVTNNAASDLARAADRARRRAGRPGAGRRRHQVLHRAAARAAPAARPGRRRARRARPPGCPTSPTPCWNAAGRSPRSRPATASPSGW